MNHYDQAAAPEQTRHFNSYRFAKSIAKVLRHDEKVGKGRVAERESIHIITKAEWRDGGGVIPKGGRPVTLVRHITDDNYEFFGATSRHGALL
jgi:hypothetical protein